jgi:hypothetical protein
MGTVSQAGATATWGPAIGYWLALVAGILIIIGIVLGMRSMMAVSPPKTS